MLPILFHVPPIHIGSMISSLNLDFGSPLAHLIVHSQSVFDSIKLYTRRLDSVVDSDAVVKQAALAHGPSHAITGWLKAFTFE